LGVGERDSWQRQPGAFAVAFSEPTPIPVAVLCSAVGDARFEKVALEALTGEQTVSEAAGRFDLHATILQIGDGHCGYSFESNIFLAPHWADLDPDEDPDAPIPVTKRKKRKRA